MSALNRRGAQLEKMKGVFAGGYGKKQMHQHHSEFTGCERFVAQMKQDEAAGEL